MARKHIAVFAALLGLASPQHAGAARPPVTVDAVDKLERTVIAPKPGKDCVTYDGAYEQAPLMKVLGPPGSRVRLQDKAVPCSKGSTCSWVRGGYVVPGDQVFASAPINGFRCIYVGSRGRLSAGFVPDAALAPATDSGAITPAWLVGRWSDGSDLIVISERNGQLMADGDGVWPGRDFAGPPGPHEGSFRGVPKISADTVTVADDICRVEARRRGPYLIFTDNSSCGGANVRFRGIYVSGSTLKP
jgi:hypothetical protein